ncbi:MAG: 2-succinyl-5-enolpyruvyl-6-hydroxy-3-cyclohexene-1-carboxylic-acid synthase [Bacteroidaceae bacterium]|nr:2-succinyl-5-enolpyruvyl-6-hydroxy-3-cyclohexene-1-carboxylic-acid synthase [Bacteroidaceae bacterium]
MYSDKENINILTALLKAHGVGKAVVCPGARNAPIVHNLNEAGLECHPVTDERSAGFYALGMSLASMQPVAVCVTSGTALMNLAPVVVEAYYRHCPLLVISADRPIERIGQLDAQTMPQQNALGCFVGMSVSLPEPADEVDRVYCNRLVNEALVGLRSRSIPVHINVPINEPLFNFSTGCLPDERMITLTTPAEDYRDICDTITLRLKNAERPMILVGQMPLNAAASEFISAVCKHIPTIYEPLSFMNGVQVEGREGVFGADAPNAGVGVGGECGEGFEGKLVEAGDDLTLRPDFILYVGGMIVSKRLKGFLRDAPSAETWIVNRDGQIHDTFRNLTRVFKVADEVCLLKMLGGILSDDSIAVAPKDKSSYRSFWLGGSEETPLDNARPVFSEEGAVRMFENALDRHGIRNNVHYANSTAVRIGCRYARHYIHVNRGANGIEGSLSTAAGYSLCQQEKTFCVIGDLSFFYDCNALWNTEIDSRLRILLLNNGGGGIFRILPGLEKSGVRDRYVMAKHNTSAEGICQAHNIVYMKATDANSLKQGVEWLTGDSEADRPMLLEVVV